MFSIRKWLYKPRKDDNSILAQFFYADEELNLVAAELDSFDGRKDPERCTALVNLLRHSQDKVLNICNQIMDEAIPDQHANRDFRVKFPDDVLQENLGGQLWFGAECLAAGSSILNREVESALMRPLAKNLTKALDDMRNMLREQCLRNPGGYSEKVKFSLRLFDQLFAEFELSYVSAMVPVKSMKEYNMQQDVIVLFSETLQRALKLGLLTQDSVDDYDPALMFTIPRLAIVCGLLIFPEGALGVDGDPQDMSEMFRPFHGLLFKIRDLLWTLNQNELLALEKVLCSVDEPVVTWSGSGEQEGGGSGVEVNDGNIRLPSVDDYIQNLYRDYPSCKQFITDFASFIAPTQDASQLLPTSTAIMATNTNIITTTTVPRRSGRGGGGESPLVRRRRRPAVPAPIAEERAASPTKDCETDDTDAESMDEDGGTSTPTVPLDQLHHHLLPECDGCSKCKTVHPAKVAAAAGTTSSPRRMRSPMHEPSPAKRLREVPLSRRVFSQPQDVLPPSSSSSLVNNNLSPSRHSVGTTSSANISPSNWDSASYCSTETSSYNSECQDDEEIALAMQAAEIANRQGLRSRFKDGQDLVHRLFVCISGVADQLQTNHASDFRNILKCVFEINCSHAEDESTDNTPSSCRSFPEMSEERVSIESAEEASERNPNISCEEAPTWIPDDLAPMCMSCETPFNLVRRRHHCRNCGKVFCGRCSSNSVPLPRFGLAKPVRVCNRCYMFQVTPFVISTAATNQQHVQD